MADSGGDKPVVFGPLMDALAALRALHPDMTVSQALVLLTVAQNTEISQVDLAERLGLSDSAVSRNIAILSKFGSRNTPGLNLITLEQRPDDRRFRTTLLTPRGRAFVATLAKLVGAYYGRSKAGG